MHGEIDLLQWHSSSSHSFAGFAHHTKQQCDLCALPLLSWLSATNLLLIMVRSTNHDKNVWFVLLLAGGWARKQANISITPLTRSTLPLGNIKVGCPKRTRSYLIYCCCTFITRRSLSNLLPPTNNLHSLQFDLVEGESPLMLLNLQSILRQP